MERKAIVCHSCGTELEQTPGGAPCEQLTGWVTISIWKGKGSVDHYNFCCFDCLQMWVEDTSPQIPNVFLNAFNEETDVDL